MSEATVVRPREVPLRVSNVTGSERCQACDDSALVCVGTESRRVRLGDDRTYEADLFGPCPACEKGFRLEFGIGTRDGKDYENPNPPWGPQGYWRGQAERGDEV